MSLTTAKKLAVKRTRMASRPVRTMVRRTRATIPSALITSRKQVLETSLMFTGRASKEVTRMGIEKALVVLANAGTDSPAAIESRGGLFFDRMNKTFRIH